MSDPNRLFPEQIADPDIDEAASDRPLYSELIKQRFKEWFIQEHPGIHSKSECKDKLLNQYDSDELWHCCPFWQRKLSNKLNARQFAIKCGVQVPKLYWHGKDPADIPFQDLPTDYVVKTSTGWSSNEVLVLKGGHSVVDGTLWPPERVIENYCEIMSHTPFSRGYVFVEELMQAAGGRRLRDCKCYVFDGRVGMVSIMDRSKRSAVRFTREGQPIHERIHEFYTTGELEDPPERLNEIVACAETLGRGYGRTFVRVDLYSTPTDVVFGEFTSAPARGRGFTPFADRLFGDMCAGMQADDPRSGSVV